MSLFSRVKNWFHKEEPEYQDSFATEGTDVAVDPGLEAQPQFASEPMPDYASEIEPAPAEATSGGKKTHIQVPLAPIVASLPPELSGRLLMDNVGDASIVISLASILPQLARGQACMSFGELREACPGVFATSADFDEHPVQLPLAVVLPRITPDMLARKQVRSQLDIPDEIVSPFAAMGRGLVISDVQRGSVSTASRVAQTDPANAPHAPAPAPRISEESLKAVTPQRAAPPQAAAPPPRPTTNPVALRAAALRSDALGAAKTRATGLPPRPGSRPPGVLPRPTGGSGVAPVAPRPGQPAIPRVASPFTGGPKTAPGQLGAPARPGGQTTPPNTVARQAGVPLSKLPRPSAAAEPSQPQAQRQPAEAPAVPRTIPGKGLPQPNAGTSTFRRPIPATGLPAQPKAATPASPATPSPAPVPAMPANPAQPPLEEHPPVLLLVSAISESWPESIKQEIALLQATNAQVGLPFSAVEAGLRKGRLCFSWQQLRSWLRPAVPREASAQDNVQLELPLRTVAPLFIAQQKSASHAQPRVAVDMSIPDLFSGGEEDLTESQTDHSVTRPMDTNFYVWEDESNKGEVVRAEQQRVAELTETEFFRRAATPNEVVNRAVTLEGVEGAVIALPDGLVIASRVPAEVNSETVAALLPQLYGKVSQCTQEFRMGELNNLKFTVGNVPWKIYRINALYFAAFGKAGKPLPGAPLHALAKELDRKVKE